MQTKTTHTKQKKESIKVKSRSQVTNKKNKTILRRTIITNTIVAILIAFTPYIFQLYEYAPEDTNKWETFLFTIEDNNYSDLRTAFWVYMSKFIPLMLMVIWFMTCNKWWYHVILIPTAMFGFQFFSAINDKSGILDVVEIYWLLPIMMVIIPFVYLIRIKLMDKLVHGIDLKKINAELAEYERRELEQQNLIKSTQK
ncbi:MAG: hypothetical protein AB8B65_07320 [Kordia sp.]|uniref:hypothetical protein n=1 Tax=Kordia sp. TaxID=1965332 RepID=UPI00385EFC5F